MSTTPPPDAHAPSAPLTRTDVARAIAENERFLTERLQPDLAEAVAALERVVDQRREYASLRDQLERLDALQPQPERLKMRVNLGSDFFAHATVDDPGRVCVHLGLGFHAELKREEAIRFSIAKETQLDERAASLRDQAGRIRAHVQATLSAIHELSGGALMGEQASGQ
mmetsp:Transcript_21107/g.56854  ORF Transcript_21107/g.56854 Transcript_21107/m.56854 type:complete len:169 (+) Transcript_21107:259-765(+)